MIASGPTVPDPTTSADALAALARWQIAIPASVRAVLAGAEGETPKPGDRVFSTAEYRDRRAAGGLA